MAAPPLEGARLSGGSSGQSEQDAAGGAAPAATADGLAAVLSVGAADDDSDADDEKDAEPEPEPEPPKGPTFAGDASDVAQCKC